MGEEWRAGNAVHGLIQEGADRDWYGTCVDAVSKCCGPSRPGGKEQLNAILATDNE